jgi:hypothetical protein
MTEPIKFTVSSRTIGPSWHFYRSLKTKFEALNLGKMDQVVSVFGAVKVFSPLYGGRLYKPDQCLSFRQVEKLARRGIKMSLALSNHYFTEDRYKQTIPILEKLHQKGNSIIIYNDELAKRIRTDFPLFDLKASVIKTITTLEDIHKNLEIYDYIALSPKLNDNISLLQSIDCKDRIILFASVRCLYYCNYDECFKTVSEMIVKNAQERRAWCKFKDNPAMNKLKIFDIKEDRFKGFSFFKVPSFINENL